MKIPCNNHNYWGLGADIRGSSPHQWYLDLTGKKQTSFLIYVANVVNSKNKDNGARY